MALPSDASDAPEPGRSHSGRARASPPALEEGRHRPLRPRRHGAAEHGRGRLAHALRQGRPHRPLDRGEDRAAVGELHLGLRGVHVHVHHVGRHLDEEERLEAPVASARRAVGLEDRLRERPVPHRAPVHEEAEVRPRRPRPVGPRHEAAHRRPLRAALHGDDVLDEPRPEQLEEPRGEPVHRGRLEERPPARLQREPRPGPGQGEQGERLRDVRGLRRGGAQELAPGGDGAEQVPDLDRGPARVPRVPDVQPPAVGDRHLGPGRARLLPGPQDEVGDGRRSRAAPPRGSRGWRSTAGPRTRGAWRWRAARAPSPRRRGSCRARRPAPARAGPRRPRSPRGPSAPPRRARSPRAPSPRRRAAPRPRRPRSC